MDYRADSQLIQSSIAPIIYLVGICEAAGHGRLWHFLKCPGGACCHREACNRQMMEPASNRWPLFQAHSGLQDPKGTPQHRPCPLPDSKGL